MVTSRLLVVGVLLSAAALTLSGCTSDQANFAVGGGNGFMSTSDSHNIPEPGAIPPATMPPTLLPSQPGQGLPGVPGNGLNKPITTPGFQGDVFHSGQVVSPPPILARVTGVTEEQAVKLVEDAGYTSRIVARDGFNFPITMDFSYNRVDLSIRDGKVVSASIG